MNTTFAPVIDALCTALADEADALARLGDCARAQLDALRAGASDAPRFEEAGLATAEAVAALEAAGQARARRLRLLARTLSLPEDAPLLRLAGCLPPAEAERLRVARARTRAAAEAASERCEALAFALSYAASIGRETLGAWRALGTTPAAHYTAAGAAAAAAPRALVNRTG